ncbi:SDR family NAD(P)-dependent oxidoreductase [Streptomyces sp. NPDC056341]|uniref:SDR family NAD(P)-dependent oxidoreductase n=1 Tax=Streptomyces sp. NPDC056341 TaxID=3345788 RepID=UPI0035E20A1D
MSKTALIAGASTGMVKRSPSTTTHPVGTLWPLCVTPSRPSRSFADLNDVPFARLDVTDAASIERAVKESIERFGAVDVVVNAAGQGRLGVIEEASADQV